MSETATLYLGRRINKVHFCLLVLALLASPTNSLVAAEREDYPKVGLVLAGGGAAGLAHVGAIRELEKLGIRPDCVVGTSMGAIVAGLYAAGYSPAELERVVLNIDWENILNDYSDRSTLNPLRRDSRADPFSATAELPIGQDEKGIQFTGGLVDGVKLTLLLRELTGSVTGAASFDDLPIPFRAIATDLETGEQVIMSDGDLALALRASMSIPGLFPAVERNNRILVDGGVVNNFPTDVARDLCADIVIGINLPNATPDRRSLNTLPGSLAQLVSLIVGRQEKANEAALQEQDIVLVPDVQDVGMLGFTKASLAVSLGAKKVVERRDELLEIQQRLSSDAIAATDEKTRSNGEVVFDQIVVNNTTSIADRIILAKLGSILVSPRLPSRRLGKILSHDLSRRPPIGNSHSFTSSEIWCQH
ncbi:MAG: patatin-like phospholipase family protein, partial [Pseudomonadota bacterium]